jgi:hypothetical protein
MTAMSISKETANATGGQPATTRPRIVGWAAAMFAARDAPDTEQQAHPGQHTGPPARLATDQRHQRRGDQQPVDGQRQDVCPPLLTGQFREMAHVGIRDDRGDG